jgi:hypothetical protein
MSTYSGNSANNPASITIPADGEDKPAASVNTALEGLMDKVVHTQLPATSTSGTYPLASRALGRIMRGVATSSETAGVADWSVQNGVNGAIFLQATLATTAVVYQPLDLPDGCTLTDVYVWLAGGGGHAFPPANKPTLRLFRLDPTTLTVTQIGITTTDPSSTVVDYEAIHFFNVGGGVSEVIDNANYKYVAGITGEAGANSLVGLRYVAAKCFFVVTKQDPGAS